ncbi:MAG: DUF5666 domain-containing protein [Acidobacteriota bacterium]
MRLCIVSTFAALQVVAQAPLPLPGFGGTVRAIDSKEITIERPDTNTIQFHCTRKTAYFKGAKQIKASAIKPGDRVTVEARRAPDGSLDAVNVRLEHSK